MHPNIYLRTFWRGTFTNSVFVAMSFAEPYKRRFEDVIKPAIEGINYRGKTLKADRVDLSKTGDSILTDIVDGISHSLMVLADVSVVGYDSKTGYAYRNGNVMYELGLALACRQSSEVLLIRDDHERFLFDVSTVPHKHLDFADTDNACALLQEEIRNRLKEIDRVRDARIRLAVATLTFNERQILATFKNYSMEHSFWFTKKENLGMLTAIPRLLDKQLIVTAGITHDGFAMYRWTELGKTLADNIDVLVPMINFSPIEAIASTVANKPDNAAT
jgi:hypothetical protein